MRGRLILAVVSVMAFGAVASISASAAGKRTVKCVGTADFCGATVSIAGGASNRQVTIHLTDTDLALVAVRVIPASSRGAFRITKGSFRQGGSEYRFTLNAVRANPRRARVILLFAAGRAPGLGGLCLTCFRP